MKQCNNDNTCVAERDAQTADKHATMPQSTAMQPVTQLSPDDVLADEGPMTPHDEHEQPTMRQIEQETITVNPSADSMESRG
ncbi:MAG: hypothetical protein K2F95_02700 [Alistipes sp.]|nr:hypothetical protein [Alistipes sp.]MDE7129197.1 hypothetical protein [Alistipes sp.]